MEPTVVERRRELRAFLFLTVFLAPILAVGTVAAWGFGIWILQMFAGPPGPQ
ncbi:MAG: periplasmic nitrate reductase, NapE protein [Xanthomonadales bacterium]|nr:periplasmic nitrate reductase, NapE protein [Xanthomonadales bacterium]MBK7145135.1 periplasmic nitrate reductase, NapE protein [Xanthomonadales bacterium]MCC6560806.1 periplasmic nitrate reductase, NapE protein [Xanthomonadales bacterium]